MGKACGYHQDEKFIEVWSENLTAQLCEGNVEIYSKEIGWEGMDWIHLVRWRDVSACSKHGFYNTREMCGLTKDMFYTQYIIASSQALRTMAVIRVTNIYAERNSNRHSVPQQPMRLTKQMYTTPVTRILLHHNQSHRRAKRRLMQLSCCRRTNATVL